MKIHIFFLSVFSFITLSGCSSQSNLCQNVIQKEVFSPNSMYKITQYERDCGATTRYSDQVMIQNTQTETEEIIVINSGTFEDIDFQWIDNSQLTISYKNPYETVRKKEKKFENISIYYNEN